MTETHVHRDGHMQASGSTRDRGVATAVVVALAGLAWLTLWAWGRSPYDGYLSHDTVEVSAVALPLFVAGWTLMTVAMMLPTSVPLVRLFDTLTARRPDHGRLMTLLVTGYLGTWATVGALAHAADRWVHWAADHVAFVAQRPWMVGTATLLLAGVYQFTPLKYHCLDKCRSPLMFVTEHWRGYDEARQALRLGVRHALFCVGCCWTLMLLMFAVGVGSIGWMLALGTVMAVEKNLWWGRRIAKPVGAGLVAAGILVVAAHV